MGRPAPSYYRIMKQSDPDHRNAHAGGFWPWRPTASEPVIIDVKTACPAAPHAIRRIHQISCSVLMLLSLAMLSRVTTPSGIRRRGCWSGIRNSTASPDQFGRSPTQSRAAVPRILLEDDRTHFLGLQICGDPAFRLWHPVRQPFNGHSQGVPRGGGKKPFIFSLGNFLFLSIFFWVFFFPTPEKFIKKPRGGFFFGGFFFFFSNLFLKQLKFNRQKCLLNGPCSRG